MKQRQILSFALILLMISFGCKKSSSSSSSDPGADAAGLYSGSWNVSGLGQVSGTVQIAKVSSSSVTLTLTLAGNPGGSLPGVTAKDGGSGKVALTYAPGDGSSLSGTVTGKSLTLNLTDGSTTMSFTGTKP